MTIEEHTTQIQALRSNLSDEAQASTILAALSEDYSALLSQLSADEVKISELSKKNADLTTANMELFLKVGKKPDIERETKDEENKLSYDDLFDEKGRLI